MYISPERLKEFQQIYEKHYGTRLTDAEAHERGIHLLTVIKQVYKPIPKQDTNN